MAGLEEKKRDKSNGEKSNGRHPLELTAVPAELFQALVKSVKELNGAGAADFDITADLKRLAQLLEKKNVTVAFGGHHKSGKSTLINALLGRAILPMDEFPETGAICTIRSGEQDAAEVHGKSGKRDIPCTTEAIRHEVSLTSQTGERRTDVHEVDSVGITLSNCVIPPQVSWIDSPGINDTPEMDERAYNAALQCDLLVWVLYSKHFLQESEVRFLSRYLAQRGPDSVIFVVNVFLAKDVKSEWDAFHVERARRMLNKVRDQASAMGFAGGSFPAVCPVSARALLGKPRSDFGGEELKSILLSIDSHQHNLVRRARLHRVARNLNELAIKVKDKVDEEKRSNAKKLRLHEKEKEAAEQRRDKFTRAIDGALDDFLKSWRTEVRQSTNSLASSISAESLTRDGTYKRKLNDSLQSATRQNMEKLAAKIETAVQQYEQAALSKEKLEQLKRMIKPDEVDVSVPDSTPSSTASEVLGVATGVVTFFFAPFLAVPAGVLASKATEKLVNGMSDAKATDAAAAKSNLQSASESAISAFEKSKKKMAEFILTSCLKSKGGNSFKPNETTVRKGESLTNAISLVAGRAASLANPGEARPVTFNLKGHKGAVSVMLTGTFNGWGKTRTYCERTDSGWSCQVELPPGRYAYKFIVDGVWRVDPGNPEREDDGYGHLNSVLNVPG